MYQTIQIQPQQGAQISVNRKCGYKGGPILSTIGMLITAQQATIIWIEVGFGGSSVSQIIIDWQVTSNQLNIEWAQIFDSQTAAMQIPVLYISGQVQQYSQGYMETDPHKSRFFSYLSLFTFFMLIQITAENLQVQFVGWEGVGQASYQLINFWYTRIAANMAAQKAFLQNRIGDWAQTLGIILTICVIGDISFSSIQSMGFLIKGDLIFILSILFQIGAAAKSAQQGLHSWQASAMEGPTPVSAQIHAATMVTAGVYQQMRQSPQQEWSSDSQQLITWLGGMSAIQGAACGILENDLKRVIAFSTTSQQGYMIMACGQSQYNLSLFHLINHAFFKALLFLSAGAVIHAIIDQQDMRKMGGLILFLPFSYIGILLGSQSLMAFPFMTGFYSKDLILEQAQIPTNYTRSVAYVQAIQAAFLSAIYSIRLLILTFISKPHFHNMITITDPSAYMKIPLIIQSLGAVYFGYISHTQVQSSGSTIFQNSIWLHPEHISLMDGEMLSTKIGNIIPPADTEVLYNNIHSQSEQLNCENQYISIQHNKTSTLTMLKYLPLITLIIFSCIQPFRFFPTPTLKIRNIRSPIINSDGGGKITKKQPITYSTQTIKHFDIIIHWVIFSSLTLSNNILRYWDRGLVEIIGPMGQVNLIHHLAFNIELMADGRINKYALIIIFFTILSQQLVKI